MKKSFFSAIKSFFAMAAIISMAACSNLATDSDDMGNPVATGDKVKVSFNLSTPDRLVYPTIDLTDYSYKITVDSGSPSEAVLSNEKLSVEVAAGQHTFTVDAYKESVKVLTGSKSATISTDSATVNIVLVAATGSKGSVSVTLPFDSSLGVQAVKAGIYDSPVGEVDSANSLTINENKVLFESSDVEAGSTKYVIFYIYADAAATSLICPYTVPLYIVAGLTTTANEPSLGAATYSANVSVQKNGSNWESSGLEVTFVNQNDSTDSVTALAAGSVYTANLPQAKTYVVNVNGRATEKTVSATAAAVTLNYAVPSLYPAQGATNAFPDTQLIMTFAQTPALIADSSVTISSEGSTIDTISVNSTTADESQRPQSGYTINVGNQQMVRVDGNSVYIQPHYNGTVSATKLQAGTSYSVDASGIVKTPEGYDGILFDDGSLSWNFTTKSAPSVSTSMSVSNATSDNSAGYFSVYGALFAAAVNGSTSTTYEIDIADGTYYELLSITAKSNQTFILHGSNSNTKGDSVVIEYVNNNHMNAGSSIRPVFYMGNGNLVLENVTFKNLTQRKISYTKDGYYGGTLNSASGGNYQAETLYFNSASGKISAYNSSFESLQDTLLTKGKLWFYNCAVKGDVDFMWGYSDVALFENCDITCLYDANSQGAAYLFESRVGKPASSDVVLGKGYVLFNSTVTVEEGVTAYFGRRASETPGAGKSTYYDQVALVNVDFVGSGSVNSSHYYSKDNYTPYGIPNSDFNTADSLYGSFADVGWKEYNISGTASTLTSASGICGVITPGEYITEYSGRRAIINRKYNVDNKTYVFDSSARWDVDTLISERGYTVASDSSLENPAAYIVDTGKSITDTAIPRTNSLAISSSDIPTGYAGVEWTSQNYQTVTVTNRSELINYAKQGGYFIIVNGMIDMTDDGSGTMLPSVGGGSTQALDSLVAKNSDYPNYAAWQAAYAAACTTSTDDSSGKSAGATGTSALYATLWKLNTAYKNIVQINVESNTAIVGADGNSGIRGGSLSLNAKNHVVIRNLKIQDAYDPFPHHESGDGYNGERDALVIQGASNHIWVDHCTFEDLITPGHVLTGGSKNEKWQTYDGLLDIKGDGANITVSYCTFKNHDKTSLIGSGDSEGSANTRKITYHHNYFYNCGQRLPMVRNTTLHIYNNVYAYSSGDYDQQYAIGPRKGVIIYAENNYFGSGITYAFKGADASAIHASGNVRNNGSTECEENVNYNGVSATDKVLFSDSANSAPAAYNYSLESVSAITDSTSGVAATSGSGDATIDGSIYGSSTGSGTSYVTITFEKNATDASITTTSQIVPSDTATSLKTAAVLGLNRSGYSFTGWASSADSATVTYTDGSSITINEDTTLYAVWTEVVAYASGTYTLANASVAQNTALEDGTSSDGAVSWSGLYSNGNNYAYTSASSSITVSVSGASIITLTGCYNGTNAKTLTVKDASDNTIVSGVYTSSNQTLSFLYTGDATTLTLSWSGMAYITAVQVSDGSSAENSVSSISVILGEIQIEVGATTTATATITATYINEYSSVVTWSSSNTEVATIDVSTGEIRTVGAGSTTITASCGGKTATASLTVTETASTVLTSVVWDWTSNAVKYYSDEGLMTEIASGLEKRIGYIVGSSSKISAYVDASNGKLGYNSAYAQINSGTKIQIPVSAGSVVTVVAYSGQAKWTVGGLEQATNTAVMTATSAGYIELDATGGYINSIKVTNVDYSEEHTKAVTVTEFDSTSSATSL